jgi:prohibitin 1
MKYLIVFLSIFLVNCFSTVNAGNKGIKIEFGEVQPMILPEGMYWAGPFTNIVEVSLRLRASTTETMAASKDMQKVHATISVNWRITENKVMETFKNLGTPDLIEDKVIDRAVSEILKAETAKLTAEEILTKRMELKQAMDLAITARLAYFGLLVEAVNLADFGFTPEFDRAVEAKQIAEQQAKQAHYDTQKALGEIEKAKGQAEAQKLLKLSLTDDLIQKLAVEKWDGKLPTTIISKDGSIPFLNLK